MHVCVSIMYMLLETTLFHFTKLNTPVCFFGRINLFTNFKLHKRKMVGVMGQQFKMTENDTFPDVIDL